MTSQTFGKKRVKLYIYINLVHAKLECSVNQLEFDQSAKQGQNCKGHDYLPVFFVSIFQNIDTKTSNHLIYFSLTTLQKGHNKNIAKA